MRLIRFDAVAPAPVERDAWVWYREARATQGALIVSVVQRDLSARY